MTNIRTPNPLAGPPAWTVYDAEVLGRIIDRVTPRLAALSLTIVENYEAEFEEYARLRPDDRDLVIENAYLHLKSLMKELTVDAPETSFDSYHFSRVGAIRMRMGISLSALLRSFNVWGRAITATFREHVDFADPGELQALFYITERISWHVEQGMASMGGGYMREASTTWSDRELTRFSMLDALITGRLDALELGDSTWSNRQMTDSYVAIVATPREDTQSISKRPQDSVRKTSRLFAKLVPDGKWLVGSRDGLLYVLWPAGDAGLTMPAQQAAEAVVREFPDMAVGIGNHYPDLKGIKTSYEEAGEAANIANCLDASTPLAFRELQLERVAHRNKLLHELARETLRPLLDYDRRKHASLLPTLEAYVNSGSNVADAGKALFVHPNTVVYRLRRVEEISGFDPRSADGLLKLSLSLLVYKFLVNETLAVEEDVLAAG